MALIINLQADTGIVDRSENTTRFYEQIRKYPTMTQEEEVEWFKKMKYGRTKKEREDARNYIICCNQRLVVAAAKKYSNKDNLMDFTNEANIGLIKAVDKFDETRGVKFASFALWYIKRSINDCKAEDQMVKPTNYSKTFHVIAKAKDKFMQKNERMPNQIELMEFINEHYHKNIKDPHDLCDIINSRVDLSSDDDEYASDVNFFNVVTASKNECEKNDAYKYNQEFITLLMEPLTEREKIIIKLMFGLEDDLKGQYKSSDVGEKLGLTKERVRQLKKLALEKMKKEYEKRMAEYEYI